MPNELPRDVAARQAGRKWAARQLKNVPDPELKAIALTSPGLTIIRSAAISFGKKYASLTDKLAAQLQFAGGAKDELMKSVTEENIHA